MRYRVTVLDEEGTEHEHRFLTEHDLKLLKINEPAIARIRFDDSPEDHEREDF